MTYTYAIYDTRTGVRQEAVFPASGPFDRELNGPGSGGSHEFKLADSDLPRSQWRALTTPWARTLVVFWDGAVKYAGVIDSRSYDVDTKTLTITHVDIRVLLAARFPFGATSYWSDSSETVPGKLVCANKTLVSIVSMVVAAGLVGPTSIYSLPIVLPGITAGTQSRTYDNFKFATVIDCLDELQNVAGGPDIDFEPRISGAGTLEWNMRTGTTAVPLISGARIDFNMTAPESGLLEVSMVEDAKNQATGMFTIGQGAEVDMIVAGRGLSGADVGSVPAMDTTQSMKDLSDKTVLFGHSDSALELLRQPTKQWAMSIQATDGEFKALRLGSLPTLELRDDPWITDGFNTLRVIGYSGEASTSKVTLQVQPFGGA
jgi:hypothetical protein